MTSAVPNQGVVPSPMTGPVGDAGCSWSPSLSDSCFQPRPTRPLLLASGTSCLPAWPSRLCTLHPCSSLPSRENERQPWWFQIQVPIPGLFLNMAVPGLAVGPGPSVPSWMSSWQLNPPSQEGSSCFPDLGKWQFHPSCGSGGPVGAVLPACKHVRSSPHHDVGDLSPGLWCHCPQPTASASRSAFRNGHHLNPSGVFSSPHPLGVRPRAHACPRTLSPAAPSACSVP